MLKKQFTNVLLFYPSYNKTIRLNQQSWLEEINNTATVTEIYEVGDNKVEIEWTVFDEEQNIVANYTKIYRPLAFELTYTYTRI